MCWLLLAALSGCGRTAALEPRAVRADGGGSATSQVPTFDAGSCVAVTCAELGLACGAVSDGCGSTLSCGNCLQPANVCLESKCIAGRCVEADAAEGTPCGTDAGCYVGVCLGGDCRPSGVDRCLCADGGVTLDAVAWQLLDAEFPSAAVSNRIHIRDDARSCGGFGANRSLVQFDLSSLAGQTVNGPATVSFTYTWDWNQYARGPSRTAEVHEVTAAWGRETTWDTAPSWNDTAWSSAQMPTMIGSLATFTIPQDVVQRWIDVPSSNDGFVIKFAQENCPYPRWPDELGSTCEVPSSATCSVVDPPRLTVPCR